MHLYKGHHYKSLPLQKYISYEYFTSVHAPLVLIKACIPMKA